MTLEVTPVNFLPHLFYLLTHAISQSWRKSLILEN